jgi:hypothetical protein
MSRIHAAPAAEALQALQLFTGHAGGWTPVHRERPQTRTRTVWRPANAPGLPALILDLADRYEDEITLGLPQSRRWAGGTGHATILWTRVENGGQLEKAKELRPLPTLILREGVSLKRLLIWALEERLPWTEVVAANKRIAYRLGTRQADADPDQLRIPCPGTRLRAGRVKPVPVVCARLETTSYSCREVTGFLPDPPVVNWWEKAS